MQLPPSLRADASILETLLSGFRKKAPIRELRVAIESRHTNWFEPGILDLMRAYGTCLAMLTRSSIRWLLMELLLTLSIFVLYGPGQIFASTYSPEELASWALIISAWAKKGKNVFVYFNNDFHGGAVEDARTLSSMLSDRKIASGQFGFLLPDLRK